MVIDESVLEGIELQFGKLSREDREALDPIAYALEAYIMSRGGRGIVPNRLAALVAVEAFLGWEDKVARRL